MARGRRRAGDAGGGAEGGDIGGGAEGGGKEDGGGEVSGNEGRPRNDGAGGGGCPQDQRTRPL